jgi:hypothetical protein
MPLRPGWQQAEQPGRQLAQGRGGDLGSPRRPRACPPGQDTNTLPHKKLRLFNF